ncbi:MAG: hypothetical protein ACJ748_09015 [Flavisolibacter sp.]
MYFLTLLIMLLDPEFIQYLEEVESSGRPCDIKFKADNGGTIFIKAKIIELSVTENDGYLRTDKGARIKLDKLIEVDGRSVEFRA